MSKIFNVIFFIIINLLKVSLCSSYNNTDIIAIKFGTYYPYIENDKTYFNAEEYYTKIHSSKIYLELYTGNETSFETGKNQTLNTILKLDEIPFVTTNIYFKQYTEINNNLLCHYNTSKSDTFTQSDGYYKFREFDTLVSFSKETFKIFTDLSLSKYNITQLNLYNTINHNISRVCGNIGLILFSGDKAYNLFGQLYKKFSLPDFSLIFNYTNFNSDEGILILGNKPHVYLPNKYKEENLISFYTTYIRDFSINCDDIKIGNNNTEETFKIKINLDMEGIEFPKNYFNIIETIYFEEYYNKNICSKENYRLYDVIICNNNFNEQMIKNFPAIVFKIGNFIIKFSGEELFYKYKNRYYFKILERATDKYIEIGRIIFKKYPTMFNPEDRLIFFYNIPENKNEEDDSLPTKYVILIIFLSVFVILLFPIGFYLGKQLYQNRKKKAYELNDNYDYTPSKEGEEPLFN